MHIVDDLKTLLTNTLAASIVNSNGKQYYVSQTCTIMENFRKKLTLEYDIVWLYRIIKMVSCITFTIIAYG